MSAAVEVLAKLVEAVEVRTRLTPPIRVEVATLGKPGGKPNPLLAWLRPTLVLRSPSGDYTAAPYGVAPEGNAGALLLASGTLLLVGAVFGAGYLLGKVAQEQPEP